MCDVFIPLADILVDTARFFRVSVHHIEQFIEDMVLIKMTSGLVGHTPELESRYKLIESCFFAKVDSSLDTYWIRNIFSEWYNEIVEPVVTWYRINSNPYSIEFILNNNAIFINSTNHE